MRKTLVALAAVIFVVFSCNFLVRAGYAGVISVGTYDKLGLPSNYFFKGEDVRIMADSSEAPIIIIITDPDSIVVHNETYYGKVYNRILSGLTDKLGAYKVEAASPSYYLPSNYAYTHFYVIPSPLPPDQAVGGKATPIEKIATKPMNNLEPLAPRVELTTLLAVVVATVAYIQKKRNGD